MAIARMEGILFWLGKANAQSSPCQAAIHSTTRAVGRSCEEQTQAVVRASPDMFRTYLVNWVYEEG